MRKKQRDLLEAGRMVKQLAPILGITVNKLMGIISKKVNRGTDSIRQYLYKGGPWPFEDMGYDDCLEMAHGILYGQQRDGKLTEQQLERKKQEIKKILDTAFFDFDKWTYHGRKSWAKECHEIYSNSKAGLIDPPIPYVYQCETDDITTDPIEGQIEWMMRDINGLNLETLYVLNRYFDAFSSITEPDMKWIDVLDCLGHIEGFISIDEFKHKLSKEEFSISCELISNNMNSKDFQQWLELISRRSYTDTTRKTDSSKIKASIEEKVRAYMNDFGFKITPLHCFIQYLVREHNGSFFDIGREYWKLFLLIKYWVSHFEAAPEIIINN